MVTLCWNTCIQCATLSVWIWVDACWCRINVCFKYCGTLVLMVFNWLISQFIARSDCSWTSLCFLFFLVSVKRHAVQPGLFRCPTNLNLSQDNLNPTSPFHSFTLFLSTGVSRLLLWDKPSPLLWEKNCFVAAPCILYRRISIILHRFPLAQLQICTQIRLEVKYFHSTLLPPPMSSCFLSVWPFSVCLSVRLLYCFSFPETVRSFRGEANVTVKTIGEVWINTKDCI